MVIRPWKLCYLLTAGDPDREDSLFMVYLLKLDAANIYFFFTVVFLFSFAFLISESFISQG